MSLGEAACSASADCVLAAACVLVASHVRSQIIRYTDLVQ
jgi:hypothetical protein